MKRLSLFGTAALAILLGTACNNDSPVPEPPQPITAGVYVLNEGGFNQNNAMLTYYDFATKQASTDFYQSVNGSSLGDTGNDMIIYGSKLYVVMTTSSYLEVADAQTAKSIKKIIMEKDGDKSSPRFILPYKNKVLVSAYDGTVAVIDTASLNIEDRITVGSTPEQMEISGDKLYVTNSGGYNYPDYDSTVSVVDLNTYTEIQKLTVGLNPTRVALGEGKLFVICNGNYFDVPAKLVSLDLATNTVTKETEINLGAIRYFEGKLYASGGFGASPTVPVINPSDLSIAAENFISDGTTLVTPYGVNVDTETGDLFVTDAKDYVSSGEVFCFGKDGKKKYSFLVTPAVSPGKVVPVKK